MYLQDIYTIYLENKYKKIIIKFYIKSNLNIYQFKISNLLKNIRINFFYFFI